MKYTKTGQKEMTSGDQDHRNRMSVFLYADSHTKYFNFHCVYCGQKVCELQGSYVYQLRDIDDLSARDGGSVNVRCYGKFCNAWYEIHL